MPFVCCQNGHLLVCQISKDGQTQLVGRGSFLNANSDGVNAESLVETDKEANTGEKSGEDCETRRQTSLIF